MKAARTISEHLTCFKKPIKMFFLIYYVKVELLNFIYVNEGGKSEVLVK